MNCNLDMDIDSICVVIFYVNMLIFFFLNIKEFYFNLILIPNLILFILFKKAYYEKFNLPSSRNYALILIIIFLFIINFCYFIILNSPLSYY